MDHLEIQTQINHAGRNLRMTAAIYHIRIAGERNSEN
jgi:hypothetical protein